MIIDFKEIPKANSFDGNQDVFENFARDFFEAIGYQIIESPSRGADRGVDLKIRELRKGISGVTEIVWLVSCKHYAYSGASISPRIEQNILDRVKSNSCHGFIGFYSTIASTGLNQNLKGLASQIEYQVFDREKIEREIVGIRCMENLFLRYFPKSYKEWKSVYYYTEPVGLLDYFLDKEFSSEKELFLEICGSTGNILKDFRSSNSLTEFVQKKSISIINIDNLTGILFNSTIPFGQVVDFVLPDLVKRAHEIDVIGKPLLLSIMLNDKGSYILYPSYLMLDENKLKILNRLFSRVKELMG
ncbi:restriction endonuclease [Algoriphagus aestuariicola]|uniref:Restriction endonuclease n=1 Tax=Algoriphagus aestuariicola TaxID=1852016 RepID=A0ABS3BL07_9BACT|nr:restriction endonuclease [Algoriphagus aestuariicola]MBN7799504.1 restriction endonuclease [Algoriphagus aestuariicola]